MNGRDLDHLLWWAANAFVCGALYDVRPASTSFALTVAFGCLRWFEYRRLDARGEW